MESYSHDVVLKHLAREDLHVAVNQRPLYVSCALHTGFHYWCKPTIRTPRIEARCVSIEVGNFPISNCTYLSYQIPKNKKKLEVSRCMLRMIMIKNAHLAHSLDAYSVCLSMKFRSRVRNLRCLLPRECFPNIF